MEEGEKSTKYFLGLEKSNAKKTEISQLKRGTVEMIVESLAEMKRLWKRL